MGHCKSCRLYTNNSLNKTISQIDLWWFGAAFHGKESLFIKSFTDATGWYNCYKCLWWRTLLGYLEFLCTCTCCELHGPQVVKQKKDCRRWRVNVNRCTSTSEVQASRTSERDKESVVQKKSCATSRNKSLTDKSLSFATHGSWENI